jgi:hypothetical protein
MRAMLLLFIFLTQFVDFRNFVVAPAVAVAIAVAIAINFSLLLAFLFFY